MKKLLILLTVFLTLFSSVLAYNFQSKTIAYFPLNNVSNMITGSQYLTAYNSPTVVAGKYGNAYSMNGSGGGTGTGSNTLYMQAGQSMTNTYFNNNDNFCASYWVNFGTLTAGAYWLWQIQDSDASPISLGLATNGTVTTKVTPWSDFIITTSNTGSFTMTNDASFHHEVMCQQYYNSSHNRYLVWEDSTIKINKTLRRDSDSYGANAYLCFLGNCNSHSYGDPKQQIFDEFAIFNATFTQSEVTTLYNSGSGCFFNQLCFLGSSFSSIKTQAGELVTSSYLSMSSIQLNVTTTTPTNKRYFIYKFGNSTLIQSNVMTPTASTSSYYTVTGLTNGQRYNIMFNASNSTTTSITSNYTFTYNPNMALRIRNNATSSYLYNWSLILPNGSSVFSGNSQYNYFKIVPLGYGSKSFQLVKDGYNTRTININLNYTSNINSTYNMDYTSLTIRAYNEESPSTQLRFNLTLNNVSTAINYSNQLTFTRNYSNTLHGFVTATISRKNFCTRKVFYNFSSYTSTSITVYLLNSSKCSPVIFTIQDGSNNNKPIENAILNFYTPIAGAYTFIGQALTDGQGNTYFNYNYQTGDYRIIITKDGYVTETLNSLPNVNQYTILLKGIGSSIYYTWAGFNWQITPNSVNSFPFVASGITIDSTNQITMTSFKINGINETFYNYSFSTNSNGANISFTINNQSKTYILNLTVIRNGETITMLKTLSYSNATYYNTTWISAGNLIANDNNYNADRWFIMLVILILFGIFGATLAGSTGASIFTIFPLTYFVANGWLGYGIYGLLVIFVGVSVFLNNKR